MKFRQMLKSLQQNINFTEKERVLFLENKELIFKNASLKQELEFKNEILKNIPIDFKNHINSLIGFCELLLNQQHNKLTEKQKKQYLANIIETAYLLNKAVSAII